MFFQNLHMADVDAQAMNIPVQPDMIFHKIQTFHGFSSKVFIIKLVTYYQLISLCRKTPG